MKPVLVIPLALCLGLFGRPALLSSDQASAPAPEAPAPDTAAAEPTTIALEPKQVRSVPVANVTRVMIGSPEVADVQVASLNELLVQAKAPGATDLVVWDDQGQRAWSVEVRDPAREAAETTLREMETQLRSIVKALDLPDVTVKREGDKFFLMGEVRDPEGLEQLEKMTSTFDHATNLVKISTLPPASLPSIKLTVQLIEMDRDGTDKLGVDWADKLTFTETTFSAPSLEKELHERFDEAFRFGSLERSGLNPVLNMLISKGKARILTEPKLVAASGKSAEAFLGVEVPIITTTSVSSGTVSQNIEFKNTGVEMKFTPTLLPDGTSIQTAVDVKVSSIDKSVAIPVSGVNVPGFRVRQTKTEIVTASGEAVLISGLLQDEEKKNMSQVPGIGDVPVLGTLFRSTEFTRGKTELIVVVTPELANQEEATADRAFLLDQALASAEVAGSVNDPILRYALQIQDRIAKSLRYPQREKELDISGRVKLRLRLLRDGSLRQVMIAESSGIEAFDQEAQRVAESQAPYPPFPSDLAQPELSLDVPVLFRP